MNGRLAGRALRAAARLSKGSQTQLVELAEMERASGRGTERILRVARTIADLCGCPTVLDQHLEEAAYFRSEDLRAAELEAS